MGAVRVGGGFGGRGADREDFDNFLWETGLSAESVSKESENTVDQIPFPQGAYKCKVGTSQIEGKGLIATAYKTGKMLPLLPAQKGEG